MPHDRIRQVHELYKKLIAASPAVGIFGHRQTGKTTLSNQLSKNYSTFDLRSTLTEANQDPSQFIKTRLRSGHYPLVIDECQLVPDLFPALKEYIRIHRQPGRFLLTGSVRFTSRKAIRESLTGRILTLELHPLILSELLQSPLSELLPRLLRIKKFDSQILSWFPEKSDRVFKQTALTTYLKKGGLPGLCFLRSERLRLDGLKSLHQLILDRDLRLVMETRLSLDTLQQFLAHIARLGWNPYRFADVTRKLGLSVPTQKALLYALESIFLVRKIRLDGKKGFIVLFEDQFEEYALSEGNHPIPLQLLSAFYRNARAQFNYRLGHICHWSSYWLNSGSHVPLVLSSEGKQLGFLPLENDQPTLSQTRSSQRFLAEYPDGKIIYLSPSSVGPKKMDERTLVTSAASLL